MEKLQKKNSSDVTSIVVSKPTLKAGAFVVAPVSVFFSLFF